MNNVSETVILFFFGLVRILNGVYILLTLVFSKANFSGFLSEKVCAVKSGSTYFSVTCEKVY